MKEFYQTCKASLFLDRGKLRKKLNLYKQAFAVVIDGVSILYIGGILLYLLFAFVRSFDELSFPFLHETLPTYFTEFSENVWVIFIAFGFRYVIGSFLSPGLLFTSTQYKLTVLPYSIATLWFIQFVKRSLLRLSLYTGSALVLTLLTELNFSVVFTVFLLLFLADVLWMIPQWVLFQLKPKYKWFTILFLVLINLLQLIVGTRVVVFSLIVLLLLCGFGLRLILQRTNWTYVTKVSDFYTWNMRLVSFVSGTKMTHPRISDTNRFDAKKRHPFQGINTIYQRIWALHFENHMDTLMQFVIVLTFMLFTLFNVVPFLLFAGVVVMTFVFGSYCRSLFLNRFTKGLVQTLPWDLLGYKRTFLQRIAFFTIPFWLPIAIYFYLQGTVVGIFQLLMMIVTFFYYLAIQIDKAISVLDARAFDYLNYDRIVSGFVISLGFLALYPWLVLLFPIIILSWIQMRRNVQNSTKQIKL